jgi:hypothetical protein
MKTYELPYGLVIETQNNGVGTVKESCKQGGENPELNAALDGVEAIMLALACAGVDIDNEPVHNAFVTAVDAIENNLG